MRKLFGIILALMLACSAISVYAEGYDEKKGLLDALGIISPISQKAEEDTVSRAEFAGIIHHFTGNGKTAFTQTYADVNKDTGFASEIISVTNAGFMIGDSTKHFYPENGITGNEAVVVCMKVLGYEEMSEASGGFSDGYKKAAAAAGFNAAYGKEALTKNQVVLIIHELLDSKVLEISSYGAQTEFKVSDENLLCAMFDIYEGEGRVTATEVTGLKEEDGVGKGEVRIGDTVFDTVLDVTDKIGAYVTFFYKDNGDSMKAVYMYEDSDDEKITLTTADIENYSKYTYKEKNRNKEHKLSLDVCVIYNGCYVDIDSLTDNDMFPADGVVELISTSGKKLYDIVKITSYEYYTVLKVSSADLLIFDKYDKETLDLENEDGEKIISVDAYGKDVELSYFKTGDMLEVLKSKNSRIIRASMVTKKVTGKPEGLDLVEKEIVLDSQKYSLYRDVEKEITDKNGNVVRKAIGLTAEGHFYINDRNVVVGFVPTADTEMQIGFIMSVKLLSEEEDYIKMAFRILAESEPKQYLTAEKMYYTSPVDGVRRKYTADELYEILPKDAEKKLIRDVYMFKMNGEGLLCELVPPVDKTSDPEYIGYSPDVFAKDWERSGIRIYEQQIGTKYLPDGNTKVFKIPRDVNAKDNLYQLSTMSGVFGSDTRSASIAVYGADENSVPKAVVAWSDDIGTSRSNIEGVMRTAPMVISSKKYSVFKDGDVGYILEGWRNGNKVTLEVSDNVGGYSVNNWGYQSKTIEDLGVGDVIDFEVDKNGRIDCILPLLIASERSSAKEEVQNSGSVTDYDALAILHTLNGKVIRGTDTTLTVNSQKDLNPQYNRTFKTNTVSSVILVEDGIVEKISINDLRKGDDIFLRSYHHRLYDVVVYR